MPALIAALLGGLAQIAGSLVGRVLLAMGLQTVVYSGVDIALQGLLTYALQNFSGLPAASVGIVGLMRVDEALSILSGAVVTAMSINGIRNGVLTKLVHK